MQIAPISSAPFAPAANRSVALSCEALVKRYGDVTAVNGLDLTIYRNECFGLLGPNGAGKTTTVEILEGLTRPNSGRVTVLGQSWGQGADRLLRARLGVQLQETQLPEKISVEEILRLFSSFYRQSRTVDGLLRLVSLEEKRTARVGKLSGGQKQRLAVACALVGDPELLFLDEPTTGLDPQARLQLWDIVENFKRRGGTVLLTTHYMEEAERLCDRVAVVDHGKVIALGSPAELIASLGAHQIVEIAIAGELQLKELTQVTGVKGVRARDNGFYALTVPNIAEALPNILATVEASGAKLLTLTTHEATLEDVFVSLTGRTLRDA